MQYMPIIISALALLVTVVSTYANMKRTNKRDAREDSASLTTVIVKLENIGDDVKEVKNDLREMKQDLKNHSERLLIVEEKIHTLNEAVFGRERAEIE